MSHYAANAITKPSAKAKLSLTMLADFVLPLSLDGVFTYQIPESMARDFAIGKRALVPFGRKKVMTALSLSVHEEALQDGIEVKDIVCFLDDSPIVSPRQLQLWRWIADYYMCTLGEVMRAALPTQLKLESETHVTLVDDFQADSPLKRRYAQIYDFLSDGKVHEVGEITRSLQMRTAMPQLHKMLEMGAVIIEEKVTEKYRPKYETYISLACPIDQINATIDSLARAPQQQATLLRYLELSDHTAGRVKKALLSAPSLKGLLEKHILQETKVQVSRGMPSDDMPVVPPHELTTAQAEAKRVVDKAFEQNKVALLHGVTGSGKTDIYIHLIIETLQRSEQTLYLVPEIALTTQLTERLRQVFGSQLLVYHSRLSDSERFELFQYIAKTTEPYVLLGVRSAVLLPMQRLGLIIVDEEHDPSYHQQEPAPRYHARQVALVLAASLKIKILLGSATPSLESYHNALQGKYQLVQLNERYGGMALPEIELVDLKRQYHRKEMQGHLSDVLVDRMRHVLEVEKKQVMVFQNRRGYSTFIQCRQCGYVPKCQNCDVSLTYHKRLRALTCHYCGYSMPLPSTCPKCGANPMLDRGVGTEKVEDEISKVFPDARLSRMDLDTTQSRLGYQRIIDEFSQHRTDILVGTQMITKGLDFSNVRLVAVLNADSLFQQPDFRQSERAFSLLEQVSGRAGRQGRVGEVIIQTSDMESEVLGYVIRHDYEGFATQQLKERELFHYPPFYRVMYLHLEHQSEQHLVEASELCQQELRRVFAHRCSMVTEPYVGRVKNRYRRQIMLKIENSASISKAKHLLREVISQLSAHTLCKGVYMWVEVD